MQHCQLPHSTATRQPGALVCPGDSPGSLVVGDIIIITCNCVSIYGIALMRLGEPEVFNHGTVHVSCCAIAEWILHTHILTSSVSWLDMLTLNKDHGLVKYIC